MPQLPDGCYYIAYGFAGLDRAVFHGTLRVDSRNGQSSASGDLYAVAERPGRQPGDIGLIPPPGMGVPIFPTADYSYYLRVISIEAAERGFTLVFEAHRFVATSTLDLKNRETPHWVIELPHYTARMMPADAPAGYPSPERFFAGDVVSSVDDQETTCGRMQIGWVSSALRKAVIEIDRVTRSEAPEDNGAGATWKSVFAPIGWEITTSVGIDNVTKWDDAPWTVADARTALREHRDSDDLDSEWRYHILVVPLIGEGTSPFGFMYDRGTRARADLMMSSHFEFPSTDAKWGALRGARNGTTVAFFRTALHEIGHEMGLGHNSTGLCIMRPTEEIAQQASVDAPFPSNIVWSFDAGDEHRLRHLPDIAIRPGGLDLGTPNPLA